ncbi:MAG: hypothetical protein ACRD1B_09100, partial [Thermoanaerobaculia bacterium]
LARDIGGISIARTARYLNRDASAMVRGVARLEDVIERDAKLKHRIERLRSDVRADKASKHD